MIGLDVYKSKKELADWWGTDPCSPHDARRLQQDSGEPSRESGQPHADQEGSYSRPQRDEVTRRVDPRLGISRSDTTASRWGRDEIRSSGYKGDKSRGHGGTATTVTDRTPKESFKKTTRGGSAHSFVQQ